MPTTVPLAQPDTPAMPAGHTPAAPQGWMDAVRTGAGVARAKRCYDQVGQFACDLTYRTFNSGQKAPVGVWA